MNEFKALDCQDCVHFETGFCVNPIVIKESDEMFPFDTPSKAIEVTMARELHCINGKYFDLSPVIAKDSRR